MAYIWPIVLLLVSNLFMTVAWYGHLKFKEQPLPLMVLASWGIAFFEYTFMVPANRIGVAVYTVTQLKIIQEVITLAVFVPFSLYFLKQPLKLDYLWAALCMCGAAYFIFRN